MCQALSYCYFPNTSLAYCILSYICTIALIVNTVHCCLLTQLPWQSRGMHWVVSGFAWGGGLAAAGLCVVLREPERARTGTQHRGYSQNMSGEATYPDEKHQEQSSGSYCPIRRSRFGNKILKDNIEI